MNEQRVNRIEQELKNWDLKQERIGRLFQFDILSHKAILVEKLKLYEHIIDKYRRTNSPDEKLAFKVIEREKNKLEKQLYPDVLGRILRKLFNTVFKKPVRKHYDAKHERQNIHQLEYELHLNGFSTISKQLAEGVNQRQESFNIEVSRYINENERMEYQLLFFKEDSGNYKFDGFKASMYSISEPKESRSHYFKIYQDKAISAVESYNLLSGRAVSKDNVWMQFDLFDKDVRDNYRVKEFHQTYGYDLGKALNEIPLKDKPDTLLDNLRKGMREPVIFLKGEVEYHYYIEANPQFKTLNVYDENFKKVDLFRVLGVRERKELRIDNKESTTQSTNERQGKVRRLR